MRKKERRFQRGRRGRNNERRVEGAQIIKRREIKGERRKRETVEARDREKKENKKRKEG